MKTKLMVIAGMIVLAGIIAAPTAAAQTVGNSDYAFQNTADDSVQLQCGDQPKGQQGGPRDGTKGENAPRDGRGNGGRKGQRSGPRDGSGNGGRHGQGGGPRDGTGNGGRHGHGGGPRDGTGPNCQKS